MNSQKGLCTRNVQEVGWWPSMSLLCVSVCLVDPLSVSICVVVYL